MLTVTREWVLLTAATLTDRQPLHTDAILTTAQADLQDSLLARVADLHHCIRPRPKVLINGLEHYEGIAGSWGCKEWRRILEGPLGIDPADVLALGPAPHTGREAEEAIWIAAAKRWTSLVIASVPYRIPRAFLNVLGVMQERGLNLALFCLTVPSLHWNEYTEKHSVVAGAAPVNGTRFEQYEAELERIADYRQRWEKREPGFSPIASVAEGLAYLHTRS